MQINNNLNAMSSLQLKLNESAQNIAAVTNVTDAIENPKAVPDFTESIVEQIPIVISYAANATAIKTQNAVEDTLLDIKA